MYILCNDMRILNLKWIKVTSVLIIAQTSLNNKLTIPSYLYFSYAINAGGAEKMQLHFYLSQSFVIKIQYIWFTEC